MLSPLTECKKKKEKEKEEKQMLETRWEGEGPAGSHPDSSWDELPLHLPRDQAARVRRELEELTVPARDIHGTQSSCKVSYQDPLLNSLGHGRKHCNCLVCREVVALAQHLTSLSKQAGRQRG